MTNSQIWFNFRDNGKIIGLNVLIYVILSLIGFYVIMVGYFVLKKSKFSNQAKKVGMMEILFFLRFFISDLLFYPIFQLLIFPISCRSYNSNGQYNSSISQDLNCIFSPNPGFLAYTTFLALILHIFLGLLNEIYNFKIRVYHFQKSPK